MNRQLCLWTAVLLTVVAPTEAQDCYESSILSPSPFMGNNLEIFKLADGSLWEVVNEYEYLYEYGPSVIICPSRGKIIIGKKSLQVKLLSAAQNKNSRVSRGNSPSPVGTWDLFEETTLQGTISGTVKRGRVFKTASGSVYEVTGLTLQLVLELQPMVTVLKNGEEYKLVVEGFDEPLICRLLNSVSRSTTNLPRAAPAGARLIESQIDDDFEGWEGETIFKLSNGQIWQQAAYAYTYHYAYRPKVLIYLGGSAYRMKVEGVDTTILVKRLK